MTVPGLAGGGELDPGGLDRFVDLASRRVGGSVVAANDETFAPKEALVLPSVPTYTARTFGHRGQVYDGWETRRRREPGQDWAIVRLGLPGIVHGVVVDTSHFTGNYPESAWVDGQWADGYPTAAELLAGDEWIGLVPNRRLRGDVRNVFASTARELVTHVRLTIAPDGGVARLRVYGEVLPDPRRLLDLSLDLAALENGGRVEECSNRYYAAPDNVIAPGRPATMGEGWETRRRRGDGNDWVRLRLAGTGHIRQAVLDTTHFVGNAPGGARILGCDATASDPADPASWWELLPRTRLQPDTRHWFSTDPTRRATHAQVDIYPDGGLGRIRLYGDLATDGRAELTHRWWDALPAAAAAGLLEHAGVPAEEAAATVADRPNGGLPAALHAGLLD
ncbi:MAG TPA: allantoicase [Mycobacteriales bacterium]|nr:allantoicase [Mycobacteriales bacterium]